MNADRKIPKYKELFQVIPGGVMYVAMEFKLNGSVIGHSTTSESIVTVPFTVFSDYGIHYD